MNEEVVRHINILAEFLTTSNKQEHIPVCDGIFLFGSRYSERIPQNGASLFLQGYGQKIICTGKFSPKQTFGPFGFPTEADWYVSLLEQTGIPRKAIILEKESTNTLENVVFGIRTCYEQKFFPKSLVLCSIPHFTLRSVATFKKQFPDIEVFSHVFELPMDFYFNPERLKRMLGEFDRFKEYFIRGDIAHIEIPENIQKSVEFLKERTL